MKDQTFTRLMTAGRIGYGSALLLRPDIPARVFAGTGGGGLATAARLLGGRHITQGAVTISRPTRGVVAAGALVDVLHMMTDLLLPVSEGNGGLPAPTPASPVRSQRSVWLQPPSAGEGSAASTPSGRPVYVLVLDDPEAGLRLT